MTDRNDRLRALLRQGDPERDGQAPAATERAVLRRLITDTARSTSPSAWGRLPAIASALTVAIVLAVAALFLFEPTGNNHPRVAGRTAVDQPSARGTIVDEFLVEGAAVDQPAVDGATMDRSTAGGANAGAGPSAGANDDAPPSIRNVQFVTKGGTRIVWVLNRNLNI